MPQREDLREIRAIGIAVEPDALYAEGVQDGGEIIGGRREYTRFRVLLDLVHSARTDTRTVASLSSLEPGDVNEALLASLGAA